MAETYAIVIAGGGPVGAALALGLSDSAHRVALLEARAVNSVIEDTRVIALSHGSRLILERLGVWQALPDVTPIQTITVSQQRRFGRVELTAAEAGVPALGYVASYAALQRTLMGALTGSAVDVVCGCTAREFKSDGGQIVLTVDEAGATRQLSARLLVFADGGDNARIAPVEERDYRQSALVCDVITDAPHENRAFERFLPQGPLALLPTTRGWSLVWTMGPERAKELATADEAQFNTGLRSAFGSLLGKMRVAGERQVFPLKLKHARRPLSPRVALIGNAAQSLHPVAGQGFNLGLRDAWELTRAVCNEDDPGDAASINTYFRERRFDRTATILFTDSLIRLFSNNIPLLDRLTSAGLSALAAIPPAKNLLVRRMMFGARG